MRYIALLLASVGLVLAVGCGDAQGPPGGSGFIEADDAIISAETSGRVLHRLFDEGVEVEAGDTLVILDASRSQLDLTAAEALRATTAASLEEARLQIERAGETERYAGLERDRVARLLSSGSATQKEMDKVEYDLALAVTSTKSARANVAVIEAQIRKIDADIDRLRRQLVDCYPTALQGGTVVEKYVEPGELLSPGKAIAKIARLDTVWVKVYLSASDFSTVKVGDAATVSTETGESSYAGLVIWTSSEAEFTPKNIQTEESRANLVYAVKVRLGNADGRLKIGMPVFVTLEP